MSFTPLTYYDASAGDRPAFPTFDGDIAVDVTIIGGGIAGCSSALHLAQRGYRVALIEAHRIGSGASGRNGGQIIPGFAAEQDTLIAAIGAADALRMWDFSVESIALLRDLLTQHSIACDWTPGHLQAAIKSRQLNALRAWQRTLIERYRYTSTRLVDADQIKSTLGTQRYRGGLHDANGGHLHPLKYVLGLATAASRAGAMIFENTQAIGITHGDSPRVTTSRGSVRSSQLIICGGAYLGDLVPTLSKRIMPVTTYVIATEPLDMDMATSLIRDNSAVADTNFILDYFRRSADHRLLFGGRVSYSGRDSTDTSKTRHRMLKVFPQLASAQIEYAWSGLLDITVNRAPDFGRIAPNVFYLQGFSGHGVALATIGGKLVSDAVAGQAERFDVFQKIKHRNFPGGNLMRTPALALAMLWYRLRDLL